MTAIWIIIIKRIIHVVRQIIQDQRRTAKDTVSLHDSKSASWYENAVTVVII